MVSGTDWTLLVLRFFLEESTSTSKKWINPGTSVSVCTVVEIHESLALISLWDSKKWVHIVVICLKHLLQIVHFSMFLYTFRPNTTKHWDSFRISRESLIQPFCEFLFQISFSLEMFLEYIKDSTMSFWSWELVGGFWPLYCAENQHHRSYIFS